MHEEMFRVQKKGRKWRKINKTRHETELSCVLRKLDVRSFHSLHVLVKFSNFLTFNRIMFQNVHVCDNAKFSTLLSAAIWFGKFYNKCLLFLPNLQFADISSCYVCVFVFYLIMFQFALVNEENIFFIE
jgi:hypothetical protein